MSAEAVGLNTGLKEKTFINGVIEKGVVLLLVFTPLAIGTVQPWSISLMEVMAFIILGLWLLRTALSKEISLVKTPLSPLISASIFLLIFQMIPLPEWLIRSISASTDKIYLTFTAHGEGIIKTISLYRGATIEEFFKFAAYASIFFVIVNHYRTEKQLEGIFITIIMMGCFISIFAVVQKILWNDRLFWFYPLKEGITSNRTFIWGPYINHNHFAAYMEMAIPIGLGILLYNMNNIHNPGGIPFKQRIVSSLQSEKLPMMIFLTLSVLIMSALVFYSLSRGGILGYTSSLVFFGALISRRRSLRKKARPLIAIGVIALSIAAITGISRIEDRFREIGETENIPRLDIWADTVNMVRDFPVLGTGAGTFRSVYPIYQTKYPVTIFEHTENDYIETLTDTGIAGLLILILMVATFLYSALKVWRKRQNRFVKCMGAGGISSCVAILIHGFTDFNLRIPANAMLLTVITATVYASLYNIKSNNPSSPSFKKGGDEGPEKEISEKYRRIYRPGRFQSSLMVTAIIICTGALLYFPARTFFADHYYSRVAYLLDDPSTINLDVLPISEKTTGNYDRAIESLKKAISINPYISSYHSELGSIYSRLGKWMVVMKGMNSRVSENTEHWEEAYDSSTGYLLSAVMLEPTNPWHHLSLGQINDIRGENPDVSEREFGRALMLAPTDISLRYTIATHYLLNGKEGDALEQARNVAFLDTSYLPPDTIRGFLMSEMMTPAHISRMYNSYLFKALEIAWRITRDPHVVKGISPDTKEAKEVVRLFLESKGYE
jgi:O-antigen ligase/tetratricopeptide (TPR) repeat protein